MPTRNQRHPQWVVTLKTLYRSDRAERVHRAFSRIAPERPIPRVVRKEDHHYEQPYRTLRAGVQ
jgi:hypothetical protein